MKGRQGNETYLQREIPPIVINVHRIFRRVHVRIKFTGEAAGHGVPLGREDRGEAQLGVRHVVGPGATSKE